MARALRSANLPLAAHLAASHPHSDIITRPVTATGLTPLHFATLLRDAHLVRVLLTAGALPDGRAILLAAQAPQPDILAQLLREAPLRVVRDCQEAVHAAAWAGSADCVKLLIERGVGVDWKAGDGATAICCAVMTDDENMVEALLSGGASVVGVRVCGVSVEEWARRKGGRVRDLVLQKADVQRRRGAVEDDI